MVAPERIREVRGMLGLAFEEHWMKDMPRSARIDTPGASHRIMVRAIKAKGIFRCDQDPWTFLDRLGKPVAISRQRNWDQGNC